MDGPRRKVDVIIHQLSAHEEQEGTWLVLDKFPTFKDTKTL